MSEEYAWLVIATAGAGLVGWANDTAALDQEAGKIHPFNITITFTYTVKA